jgi:hypothetical protein
MSGSAKDGQSCGPFKPKSPNAPIPSLQKSGSHRAQAFIHFTLLNTLGHGIFGQSFTSESKSSGKNRSDPRKLRDLRGMIDCPLAHRTFPQ